VPFPAQKFTEDEDEFILVATHNKVSITQVARALNRSKEGVRYRQHVLLMRSATDAAPFTQDEDQRLLAARKSGTLWLDISVEFNRSLSIVQRRYKRLRERERDEEKRRRSAAPKEPPMPKISGDPINFPMQAENHATATLSADPRGFAAYSDTGNKKTALGIKLPLIYRGANQ
jgi:hypothetical protein